MGRVANVGVAAAWERRLARQPRDRLPVSEFCRQEGVSPKSFYAWRKRLHGAAAVPLFVPVEASDSAVPKPKCPAGGALRLEFPSGAVLTLPAEAAEELLAAAVRVALRSGTTEEQPSC